MGVAGGCRIQAVAYSIPAGRAQPESVARAARWTPRGECAIVRRDPEPYGEDPMTDHVETLGRSLVQHGPLNDRIYLMRLHRPDLPALLPALERLARDRRYGKILARIPADASAAFKAGGYAPEVVVPGMMAAAQDGLFVTRYLSSERSREREPERLAAVRRALQQIAVKCMIDRIAREQLDSSGDVQQGDTIHFTGRT